MTAQRPLSISQAAKKLGVSISTLRRWEKSGKIAPERTLGGQRRYFLKPRVKTNPQIYLNTLIVVIAVIQILVLFLSRTDSLALVSKFKPEPEAEATEIAKYPKVLGQGDEDKVYGQMVFEEGQERARIDLLYEFDQLPVSVTATTTWATSVYVEEMDKSGFSLKVTDPVASGSGVLYWLALW